MIFLLGVGFESIIIGYEGGEYTQRLYLTKFSHYFPNQPPLTHLSHHFNYAFVIKGVFFELGVEFGYYATSYRVIFFEGNIP